MGEEHTSHFYLPFSERLAYSSDETPVMGGREGGRDLLRSTNLEDKEI